MATGTIVVRGHPSRRIALRDAPQDEVLNPHGEEALLRRRLEPRDPRSILRDAREERAPQDEVGDRFTPLRMRLDEDADMIRTSAARRTAALDIDDLVAHHERVEQGIHLVADGLAPVLRNLRDGDRGDAAMAAMWSNLNLAVDASFQQRRENAGKYPPGGIPAKLGFEHLADAGQRHRIDRDDLHGNGGALGRALADPCL